jgi:CheY-like chemotaxis protein
MPARRVLVLDPTFERTHARGQDPDVVARVVSTVSDAVAELAATGYEAVFFRVDRPREVSMIVRLKNFVSDIPLVALVPKRSASLDALARESGADEVLDVPSDRPIAAALDRFSRSRALLARSRELREEARTAIQRSREILEDSFDLMDIPVDQLIPLLIDDDADHALFMRRTFRALQLPWPLPALRSGEEAFAYLEGRGTYADRALYPLPSLILLDLRLPGTSGLEILQWIRARSAFAETTVFMMSSSGLREDVELALAHGADHYFVKPLTLDGLEGTTRVMIARWALIRKALVPPR